MELIMDQSNITERQQSNSILIWGVIAVILSILMVVNNTSPAVLGASFFGKFFGIIVGSIVGLIGALMGDGIRKFACPDSFFTTGGMSSIITTKLFWMIGPQSIGVFIGVALGIGIVLH